MRCKSASKYIVPPVKVDLPKAAEFKLIRALIDDLGVGEEDGDLMGAIRARNVPNFLSSVSRYDARSIIARLDTEDPRSIDLFRRQYQLGALLKKFPFPQSHIDTYTPAFEKFLSAEEQCRLFNVENYKAIDRLNSSHPKFFGVIEDLRKEIEDLIGSTPDIEKVYVEAKHGPGQCAGGLYRDGKTTVFYKLSTLPYSVTQSALCYAKDCIESDPRWIGALMDDYRRVKQIPMWSPIDVEDFWTYVFELRDASTLTSVPKTALVDRFIAMEAVFNVFLQLGIDGVIRQLLKTWGVNLDSQEKNQKLALEGSVSGELVTLDLKSASDTVSLRVCELLLPPLWYNLLLDLRMASGVVKLPGKDNGTRTIVFEKMSSMGNGFTFVLESLIFAAIVRVVMRREGVKGKSAIYGDDIVCPQIVASSVIDLLRLLGFEINDDKSFVDGPFRESCGTDYWLGHNVRPLFVTDTFEKVPKLFHLYNSLLELENEYGEGAFARSRAILRTWIPEHFAHRYRGPRTPDTDTHIFDDTYHLPIDTEGYRFFYRLIEKAHRQKVPGKMFLFRKLMVCLRGQPRDIWSNSRDRVALNKWDWRKRLDTGCAFDVTRRNATFYSCVASISADKADYSNRSRWYR